ncbi:alpha/beta hydrolase [Allonocardiopsis opalescens]|uniref:Pimeloyl-ACP methyl ester carboxylesterase n=1 Tax=Allonocardiopsis opalescens TaxID=1144618 RepID=A0A2T0Q869_9ACTN|nr:alpha/beta hydrolase [Allonocardiopsis opalescens]PRY00025.1 pimeloyl-ACP methyl ester carboxylesterase [Allonocardiopsis opalescens]
MARNRMGKLVGAVVGAGVAAAGITAAVVTERRLVSRMRSRRAPEQEPPLPPFGSLRGRTVPVVADDGTPLHAEVDDLPDDAQRLGAAPPTVVFCHGYALSSDCWHYQRLALRGRVRMVFWDQRAHGRSRRGAPANTSIEQLGRDLHQVLRATVPDDGPVLLVGHSMGGMTVLSLAADHPELFGTQIVGAALVSTSGKLAEVTLGLPAFLGRTVGLSVTPLMRAAGWQSAIVDRGRKASGDLSYLATRFLGFGDAEVSTDVIEQLEEMIQRTPTDVVAEFLPALTSHDKLAAVGVFSGVPTLVICGDSDRMTPIRHSERIAEALPEAEFVRIASAGHLAIMERPTVVNAAITRLLHRVTGGRLSELPATA